MTEPTGDVLRVLSYNLRFASEDDPQPWSRRRRPMATLLAGLEPHLIGTQEGLADQLDDLTSLLNQTLSLPGRSRLDGPYRWVGQGRHGGRTEEYSAIIYDSRRLEPGPITHRWLSDTPDVPGSRSWGNDIPRMMTEAHFTDRRSGRALVLVNTHFDHLSEGARQRSARFVRDRIRRLDDPASGRIVVLTGDFNTAAPTSACYRILLDTPLDDTCSTATRPGPAWGSYTDYRPPSPGAERIDWVLVSPGVPVGRAGVVDEAPEGQYPSDHLPLLADLEL